MTYKYTYTPLANVSEIIDEVANEFGLSPDVDGGNFDSLDLKSQVWFLPNLFIFIKVLVKLGTKLKHFVPSSKLHYIQSINDVKDFYSQPVHNITKYTRMARDETLPENLSIRENPARFHPNDREAVHGGISIHQVFIFTFRYYCISR